MVIDTLAGTRVSSTTGIFTTGIFDSVYSPKLAHITVDSVRIGNKSWWTGYQVAYTATACSLFDSTTAKAAIPAYYWINGGVATVVFAGAEAACTHYAQIKVPSYLLPGQSFRPFVAGTCPIDSAGTKINGILYFNSSTDYLIITNKNLDAIKHASNNSGLPYNTSITYPLVY
jgi:hypothetical protein